RVVPRGRAAHLGEGEGGAEVFQRGGDFQIVGGADLAQVAGDGDRLIAVGAHVHDGQRTQTLGQGRAVGADQQRHVGETGNLGPQRLEYLDLGAGVGDVVLAPDDVGDVHVDVIDDRWQSVEEQAVLADQNRVGHGGGIHLGVPARQVFPGNALAFQLEAPVRT